MTWKDRILNSALYVFAASIIITVVTVSYFLLAPVTILKDWHISVVNPQPSYSIGQDLTVQSKYTKTRDINGIARRHLECTNSNLTNVTYPLSTAVADHPAGVGTGTGVIITIPTIAVPATCKVAIDVSYQPYPFRTVTQYNSTPSFKVTR